MINSLVVKDVPDDYLKWFEEHDLAQGIEWDYWWLGEDVKDRGFLMIFNREDDMLAFRIANRFI